MHVAQHVLRYRHGTIGYGLRCLIHLQGSRDLTWGLLWWVGRDLALGLLWWVGSWSRVYCSLFGELWSNVASKATCRIIWSSAGYDHDDSQSTWYKRSCEAPMYFYNWVVCWHSQSLYPWMKLAYFCDKLGVTVNASLGWRECWYCSIKGRITSLRSWLWPGSHGLWLGKLAPLASRPPSAPLISGFWLYCRGVWLVGWASDLYHRASIFTIQWRDDM